MASASTEDEGGKQPRKLLHTAIGSSVSGLISRVFCHPLDTVKSRLQGANGAQYRGAVHCIRHTLAAEGLLGLYRGFGAVAGLGTPASCLYVSTYETLKKVLSADETELAFFGHMAAGMGAETVACLLYVPVDIVKERLQVQQPHVAQGVSAPPAYRGSLDALRVICRTEGLRGIYKGYYATLASFGPFSALYFAFYEQMRGVAAVATGARDKSRLAPASTMAASATAAAGAALVTSPLDLAKLRLQTQRQLAPGELVPEGHLRGLVHALRTVYSEGGVSALFRGVGARIAFQAPQVCVAFTAYEECRRIAEVLL